MSALSAARDTPMYAPQSNTQSYPMEAATTVYEGSIVCINASGNATPGIVSASLIAVGRANETVVNSGAAAAKNVSVESGTFRWANGSSITKASVGALCWIDDDQTVSTTSSGKSICGTIAQVDSSGVWVQMAVQGPIDASNLTAFENNLSSTASGAGASLVGILDTGTLITATNVEDALQEIVKKANAADGVPIAFPMILANATTGSIMATLTPGFAGKIRKITASVVSACTTTAKLATFTPAIGGVSITGGALALTSTNCSTLGSAVNGSSVTSNNAFGASDAITVVASSVTAFAEGQVQVYLFIQSA